MGTCRMSSWTCSLRDGGLCGPTVLKWQVKKQKDNLRQEVRKIWIKYKNGYWTFLKWQLKCTFAMAPVQQKTHVLNTTVNTDNVMYNAVGNLFSCMDGCRVHVSCQCPLTWNDKYNSSNIIRITPPPHTNSIKHNTALAHCAHQCVNCA